MANKTGGSLVGEELERAQRALDDLTPLERLAASICQSTYIECGGTYTNSRRADLGLTDVADSGGAPAK